MVGVWTLLTCGDGVTELPRGPVVNLFENVRAGAVGELKAVSNQVRSVLEIVSMYILESCGCLVDG